MLRDRRTTQIEERLDSLISLMKTTGLPQDDLGPEMLAELMERQAVPKQKSQAKEMPNPDNPWFVPDTYNCHAPTSCICRLEAGDPPPPPDTDDALLKVYRTELMPSHPFVVISSSTVAATLRTKSPFLMAAIRMAASRRSLRSMKSQMYHLMKELSDRMLVQSERSMDLLLGIIVILGHYHNHCFLHAQLSNLVSLAVTLTGDLGLTGPPARNERSILLVAKSCHPVPRTNEERRALVGVWFVSSAVESTKFTRYVHQCLQELEQDMEYISDINLVQLVRVQHLNARIARFTSQQKSEEEMPMFETVQIPRDVCVSAFENELELFRRNLPTSLQQDISLYHHQTTATCSMLVFAISLLARWAKMTAPATTNKTPDYVLGNPAGPSGGTSSATVANIDTELLSAEFSTASNRPGYSPTPTVSASESGGGDRESCQYGQRNAQFKPDPSLPSAVSALQARLKQQHPGLHIDIHTILSKLQLKFQQASALLQESCVESECNDQNIWSMSAIKILVTRAKLEQWTEIVTEGTEVEDYMEGMQSYVNMGGSSGNAIPGAYFEIDGFHIPNFSDEISPEQMMNLAPGTGETSWFDGYMTWTEMMMNSMGNARAPHGR
ncbi:hypothetical protein FSARC_11916 [Fusarium sarcochroum]|uniref:Transcription factor n=1 Tax=Fusarium sarcochroum TaxID=1208366 RepID=A0A8H4TC95_9HYPO|nr:hypothetical protein FSARC_11916 [Fusarium sarcochroum]